MPGTSLFDKDKQQMPRTKKTKQQRNHSLSLSTQHIGQVHTVKGKRKETTSTSASDLSAQAKDSPLHGTA
eukprot:6480937-Amphidinium_carterae.1